MESRIFKNTLKVRVQNEQALQFALNFPWDSKFCSSVVDYPFTPETQVKIPMLYKFQGPRSILLREELTKERKTTWIENWRETCRRLHGVLWVWNIVETYYLPISEYWIILRARNLWRSEFHANQKTTIEHSKLGNFWGRRLGVPFSDERS